MRYERAIVRCLFPRQYPILTVIVQCTIIRLLILKFFGYEKLILLCAALLIFNLHMRVAERVRLICTHNTHLLCEEV